jgi:small ligand-binding sensory domain FIST
MSHNYKAFASALAAGKDWKKAVREAAGKIERDLGRTAADLTLFFVSEGFDGATPEAVAALIAEKIPSKVLIGCNSSGVIGAKSEIEMEPAVSAMAMRLPGVKLTPFYLTPEDTAAQNGNDLIGRLDIYPTDKPHFICLADPETADIMRLLADFNDGYKGLPIVGGLASGTVMGATNWMCLNGAVYKEGAVGVAMSGAIEFEVIVAQGCRPIGKPLVITRADGNVLYELAGRPALEVVRELLSSLPGSERALAEQSLSVGLVMNENQSTFRRGDFLVRNLMGFDPDAGSLVVGARLKVGQTLQFQVRDASTSSEDLIELLEKSETIHHDSAPKGALLVSCCGRGRNFYGKPDHDAKAIQAVKGPLPLTGFFANGEIGPVGSKNYVHGYTSSLVILR